VSQTLEYQTPSHARQSPTVVFTLLCVMMFLQFFVWGAWYVTAANFMIAKNAAGSIASAYTVSPIAAIVSPFFLGMIADRFFATEKVLAVLHFLGAVALAAAPAAMGVSPTMFVVALLLHMLCYMPTIGLTNTMSFHNLSDQEKQFPFVRVFGTLGWIAANLVVSAIGADQTEMQFYVAAVAGVALAVFSFFLPHTPPPAQGKEVSAREIIGVDALAMLKRPSYLIFMVSAFLICIPLAAYYSSANAFVQTAGVSRIAATMSLGQMAEVVFMLAMPLFFRSLGVKWMLAIGMLAWVVRYGLFAAAAPNAVLSMIILGILLHGICYDFFFVTGFIYTDKKANKEIRGQAQGLLVLVTYGLGLGIGAQMIGVVLERTVGSARLTQLTTMTAKETQLKADQQKLAAGATLEKAALQVQIDAQHQQVESLRTTLLAEFRRFWLVPCVIAAVVFLLFAALFRDDAKEPVEPLPERRGFAVVPPTSGDGSTP
jgi:nucleoside transporter